MGACFLLVVLIMLLLRQLKGCRAKVTDKLSGIRKKFFFNGLIRSISISYVKLLMTCGIQFQLLIAHSKYMKNNDLYLALGMSSFAISFILFVSIFL